MIQRNLCNQTLIDETLYSKLRNLANGKSDLILLHILAIGYNLARSGVARDASRRIATLTTHSLR